MRNETRTNPQLSDAGAALLQRVETIRARIPALSDAELCAYIEGYDARVLSNGDVDAAELARIAAFLYATYTSQVTLCWCSGGIALDLCVHDLALAEYRRRAARKERARVKARERYAAKRAATQPTATKPARKRTAVPVESIPYDPSNPFSGW